MKAKTAVELQIEQAKQQEAHSSRKSQWNFIKHTSISIRDFAVRVRGTLGYLYNWQQDKGYKKYGTHMYPIRMQYRFSRMALEEIVDAAQYILADIDKVDFHVAKGFKLVTDIERILSSDLEVHADELNEIRSMLSGIRSCFTAIVEDTEDAPVVSIMQNPDSSTRR